MKRFLIATTIFLLILIIFSLTSSVNSELLVYSAAGLIKPMEEIALEFETEYDIEVNLQFNGSGVLMNQIETVKRGDVFIAADSWYVKELYKKEIVAEYKNIAKHTPVVIVTINNPGNIKNFIDILKDETRLIVANKNAAIGKVTEEIFIKNNIKDDVKKNIIAKAETVNKVRMYILLNQAEAGIVWKANYYEN